MIFIKYPEPGRVKTRLAAHLGPEAACDLYQCFIEDIVNATDTLPAEKQICCHPPETMEKTARWLGGRRCVAPQTGKNLMERMQRAFEAAFARGTDQAALIGSDLPDLPGRLIIRAFDALSDADAVIGPAMDGGYYLIGFRRNGFTPAIFKDMTWSAPDVFGKTMAAFARAGRAVSALPAWNDLDEVADLRRMMQDAAARRRAPRTAAYLARLGF